MSGTGSEPVDVWVRDGRPVRFGWRGRIYTVIFVRDRWLAPDAGSPLVAARECWRVEATPQRGGPPVLYELCHDTAAGRWSLSDG